MTLFWGVLCCNQAGLYRYRQNNIIFCYCNMCMSYDNVKEMKKR